MYELYRYQNARHNDKKHCHNFDRVSKNKKNQDLNYTIFSVSIFYIQSAHYS